MQPDLRYAKTADGVHIAYTVVGEGPPLVLAPTMTQSIEWSFEDTACARLIERLASFSRVILFDKRGTGRSDPMLNAPTLEERAEDIVAVLDASLVDRAVLFGVSEGGSMCLMLAATHPERVAGVITWGTLVRAVADEGDMDDPYILTRALVDPWLANLDNWGTGSAGYDFWNPSVANDVAHQRSAIRREQLGASPAMARSIAAAVAATDVRPILGSVDVPVLVLHRTNDIISISHAHHLAARLPKARFVELVGQDHYPWIGDADDALNEVAEFVTGVRPTTSYDRVMAAVLFTDIVGSTAFASRVGDDRWRDAVERHEQLVRRLVDRHRGRFVKSTGDGMLATFDGPSRAVRCAQAIVEGVPTIGLEVRAGVHAGEIEVLDTDVSGISVHIAHRVMSKAGPGDVYVTSTIKELTAGSELHFEYLGEHLLRGVLDPFTLYRAKID